MEYSVLGRTGLRVSRLGFGGAPIGIAGYLGGEDRDDPEFQRRAVEALRAAAASGVNYFDTAPGYGDGRSERIFGEALEKVRGDVVLATKVGIGGLGVGKVGTGGAGTGGVGTGGGSTGGAETGGVSTGGAGIGEAGSGRESTEYEKRTEALRAGLERLRTSHVDVLQLHGSWWDRETADRVMGSDLPAWTEEMRRRGLARFIGITAEGPSGPLEELLATGRFDVMEIGYNAIYQGACDYQREPRGIVPLARSLGIGVTTMRPATSGALQKLLRTEFPEIDLKRVTRLAINFVLSTPEVDCVVVGMKTPEEVAENVALASDASLRLDLRRLHDRFDGRPVA